MSKNLKLCKNHSINNVDSFNCRMFNSKRFMYTYFDTLYFGAIYNLFMNSPKELKFRFLMKLLIFNTNFIHNYVSVFDYGNTQI